jgi:hypothetical protein
MTQAPDPAAQAAALQAKLREVHGISGRNLRQSLARARRVLPRHLRKAGLEIVEAEALVGHPKLERMIDGPRLAAIQKDFEANLDAVDVARMRSDRRLNMAARIAAYVLIVAGAFISWMVWAGHL